MSAIVLAGQSQLSQCTLADLAVFNAALNALTNKSVTVYDDAIGGTALLKAAAQAVIPHGYWLDKVDSDSPLVPVLARSFDAVWFVQGEQDAQVGMGEAAYLAGLVELHAILAGSQGRKPAELPFIVTPLGNAARIYSGGWAIRNAHLKALDYPGFVLGPEYVDLPVTSDNIHLTDAARATFLARGAALIAPALGIAPPAVSGGGGGGGGGGAIAVKVKTFTRDISLTTDQVITGVGFQPKGARFSALLNGSSYASWDGKDDGVTASCLYDDAFAAGGAYARVNGYSIYLTSGSTAIAAGKIKSFDADGCTIKWDKTGTPGGTAEISVEFVG